MQIPPFARREQKFRLGLSLAAKIAVSAVKVLSGPVSAFDSPTVFNGGLERSRQKDKNWSMAGERHLIRFPTIRMELIKQLKDAAGVTVNDIIFAVFTGAVRRYCIAKDDPLLRDEGGKKLRMRALMPIAFPRPAAKDPSQSMNNKWCFLSVEMPINEPDAVGRVATAAAITSALKDSPMAPVQLAIQNKALPWVPRAIAQDTAYQLFRRHSVVFSNVPGPQEPVFWAGEQVVGAQMIYPNLLPQVGILSYNGHLYGNLVIDPELVGDAALFRRSMMDELAELERALL